MISSRAQDLTDSDITELVNTAQFDVIMQRCSQSIEDGAEMVNTLLSAGSKPTSADVLNATEALARIRSSSDTLLDCAYFRSLPRAIEIEFEGKWKSLGRKILDAEAAYTKLTEDSKSSGTKS